MFSCLALASSAFATTRIWLGNTALWSNSGNWSPGGIPQNGDSLSFPVGNQFTVFSMNNDLANLSVEGITFTGAGYTLNGNALTLNQGITDNHSGALNRVNCALQFTSGGGRFNSIDFGQLEIGGTTTLANNQDLIVTPLVTNLTVSGIIQGNGGLIKRGDGVLFLRGNSANTYTGATRVEGGSLHLAKPSGARAISADVTIDADFIGSASLSDDLPGQYPPTLSMLITNGGSWFITNGATVSSLSMDDAKLGGTGLLTLECDVTAQGFCQAFCSFNLGNQSRTFSVHLDGSAEQLDVFGAILGPLGQSNSGIIKEGEGLLILKSQNTYLGPTLIKDGQLIVQHGGALGASGAGSETRLQGGALKFEGGSFTCPEPIVADLRAVIEFSGSNTLTGPLTLNATCGFWGDFNSDFLEIRSTIDGPGGLPDFYGPGGIQIWIGKVRLSGTAPNTFGGGTLVGAAGLGWQGVLELAKPDNVVATPDLVFVRGYGAPAGEAFLRQFQEGGITNVLIGHSAAWQLNGHTATPTALAFTGDGSVDTQGGLLQLTNPGTNQLRVILDQFIHDYTAGISGRLLCTAPSNSFLIESNLTLNVAARVSGGASIIKEGLGKLRFSNSNSFTGPVTVNAGQFTAAHAFALGTTAAGTFVNDNGSLALDGGFSGVEFAGETVTLNSTNAAALISLGPVTNTWSGNIVLQRTAGIVVQDPAGALTHFGGISQFDSSAISGPGGFTKSGGGAMFVTALTGGNTYTGTTTITEGLLEATRAGHSLSDTIVVTGGNAVLRTGRPGTIFTSVPTVLPVGTSITVTNGALWTMNPTNFENLSRLVGDGRLDLGGGGALTVSNSASCTFSGAVSGSGALNKRGLATLRFTGQSPLYTGPATVFDGTYKVDGYFAGSPVTVKPSSILRGSGAVGDVTVENGGVVRLDPRNPGVLGGAMQFNSATFQTGGVLAAGFFGPDPTGGNDSLYVLTGVTLSNSAHSFGFLYPPHEGDVITLIQNVSANAINGAFSGFPEGALRNIGQIPVVASYVGGNGNDMTLTVTNLPLGGGGSQLFSGPRTNSLIPNDCSLLSLVITNRGGVTISNLHGTLRSLTAGVVVTISESSFPALVANARGTNATPFQIRTTSAFPCGGGAQFELVLTGSNIPPVAILYTLPGASGFHLDLDGIHDEVDVAANSFASVVNNFTIELWANPGGNRTQTAETNTGISGVSVPLHQNQRFAVFPDRGNIAYGLSHVGAGLSIGRNGISAYEQGTNHLPSRLVYSNAVSGWTHVALVYASRQPKLYVNGELVRSGSASLFPNVHPSASLGGSTQAAYGNFDGQLDEVRIWNTALSQTQIQSNMTRSLAGTEPGLVTYFRCDEGSGDVLTDSAAASPNPTGSLADGARFALSDRGPFTLADGPACDSGGGACESCLVVSGTFTTNTPTLLAPLSPDGSPSLCLPAKPCPGTFPLALPPTPFFQHTFANSSGTQLCVTAQLHFDCPAAPQGAMYAAAYLGSMDTNAPCANYLGDAGGDGTAAFSFLVPAGSNVVLVVTSWTPGIGCDDYSLELFGLPCPPPVLAISHEAEPQKVRVHWSTAYPEFHAQQVSTLPGSFSDIQQPPAIVGGRYALTNITANSNQFYRLVKP